MLIRPLIRFLGFIHTTTQGPRWGAALIPKAGLWRQVRGQKQGSKAGPMPGGDAVVRDGETRQAVVPEEGVGQGGERRQADQRKLRGAPGGEGFGTPVPPRSILTWRA